MGSPAGERSRDDDYASPLHPVTISEPLAVGVHEVTFGEWDACVSEGGCNGYRPDDAGWGRGRRPVINVSWDDALSYVSWLSKKTGWRYRLLSESEWEYAARAGTTAPFHYGETISTDQANYDGRYGYGLGREGEKRGKTVEVGTFPPNAFGLHEVHGNVLEWVEDCWHESYEGAPEDGSSWAGATDCAKRVVRGGSWYNEPRHLRSAYRGGNPPALRNAGLGFRVARALTP